MQDICITVVQGCKPEAHDPRLPIIADDAPVMQSTHDGVSVVVLKGDLATPMLRNAGAHKHQLIAATKCFDPLNEQAGQFHGLVTDVAQIRAQHEINSDLRDGQTYNGLGATEHLPDIRGRVVMRVKIKRGRMAKPACQGLAEDIAFWAMPSAPP